MDVPVGCNLWTLILEISAGENENLQVPTNNHDVRDFSKDGSEFRE